MSTERKRMEWIVGLFLFIGFGVIATMVVIFGRVGQGFEKMYSITVEFPNASGLVKGADVMLSGARIGVTKRAPALTGDHYKVAVEMSLKDSVLIPRASVFQIRSNGMLGDSYVDVTPPAHFKPGDIAHDGERIAGERAEGLDDLTKKGGQMMDTLNDQVLNKVSAELDEIKIATKNVNTGLLSQQNLKNLEDTFTNLKNASAQFSEATQRLDLVVAKISDAVDSTKGTLKTVDAAVTDLRPAIADVRKMASSATKTVDSARSLVEKATAGDGPLGTLVSDRQTAENLRALLSNLRRSGVLFYKDRPVPHAETPAPETPKRR
jgi:phospholipid/cholesterol/gamma-HCH transport system substrate-binding protein